MNIWAPNQDEFVFLLLLQAAMAMDALETIMHVPLRVLAQCIFLQMVLMSWFCMMYIMYQDQEELAFVGQMDMHGYSILFERGSWKMRKGSRLIVKGTKKGTLYCLHGNAISGKFIALAEVHSHTKLWHKRLGHMSQKGLASLCNLKKLDAKGTKLDFCNEYQYGKQVKCSV